MKFEFRAPSKHQSRFDRTILGLFSTFWGIYGFLTFKPKNFNLIRPRQRRLEKGRVDACIYGRKFIVIKMYFAVEETKKLSALVSSIFIRLFWRRFARGDFPWIVCSLAIEWMCTRGCVPVQQACRIPVPSCTDRSRNAFCVAIRQITSLVRAVGQKWNETEMVALKNGQEAKKSAIYFAFGFVKPVFIAGKTLEICTHSHQIYIRMKQRRKIRNMKFHFAHFSVLFWAVLIVAVDASAWRRQRAISVLAIDGIVCVSSPPNFYSFFTPDAAIYSIVNFQFAFAIPNVYVSLIQSSRDKRKRCRHDFIVQFRRVLAPFSHRTSSIGWRLEIDDDYSRLSKKVHAHVVLNAIL